MSVRPYLGLCTGTLSVPYPFFTGLKREKGIRLETVDKDETGGMFGMTYVSFPRTTLSGDHSRRTPDFPPLSYPSP